MKGLVFVIGMTMVAPVLAAQQESMKLPAKTVRSLSLESKLQTSALVPTETSYVAPAYRAAVGMNLADITKSKGNVAIDAFIKPQAAMTLSYSSYSEEEKRKKLNNNKLSVDYTQFGIGANFYFKPLTSTYNFAAGPSMIFETEKDAVYTEKNTGISVKAVAIFKPIEHLMMQGGAITTVMGADTKTDALAGVGLLF